MTASVSPGADPEYLLSGIGKGAENYYLKAIEVSGEPPGVWQGDGATELELSGEIDPDVMRDLYTHLTDPRQQEQVNQSLSAIDAEPGSPEWQEQADKIRATARLGGKLRDYTRLNEKRIAEALEKLPPEATPEERRAAEVAIRRDPVAARPYVDWTNSASKSWTLYHASLQVRSAEARDAGDLEAATYWADRADEVWGAWSKGNQAGLEYLQENAGFARQGRWQGKDADGKSTGRRVDAHRFTIASFRQHTNRDDGPHMHVHNAILNRVPVPETDAVSGETSTKWMSIDGQLIFQHAKAAGHVAERVAEEELTRLHGVRFATREDGTTREIMGISAELRDEHSSRRHAVTAKTAELAAAYEEKKGYAPSARVLAQLAQEATLKTRKAKAHEAPSREDLLQRWEDASVTRVRQSLRDVPEQVMEAAEVNGTEAVPFEPEKVIREAVEAVELRKAEWRRNDLLVEVARKVPDCLGGLDAHQMRSLVDELTDQALDPESDYGVLRVTPPELIETPESLLLDNGESAYAKPGGARFTTGRHWEAEERIAKAPAQHGPSIEHDLVEQVITERGLNESQGASVRGIATSGRFADVLVGPAGTGKSYSMGALAAAWETSGRGVLGLATSQNAAQVLAKDGIGQTANLAKLLSEYDKVGGPGEGYQITPGALVIVDESSMVDTRTLDRVRGLVDAAGGKLLLTGDPAQLTAVGAGGAFGQLTDEMSDVYTLDEVRRFDADWEREASLRLRDGDEQVLVDYEDRGRIYSGTRAEMMRQSYQDWLADTLNGETSALTVETREDAADLATRARQDLIRLGLVEDAEGIELHNETHASRGDRIALRKIDRNIQSSGGRFATNRDTAVVRGVADDGSMMVELEDGDRMRLPSAYVQKHVELAYAGTAHSVQGATEGTSGTLAGEGSTRNAVYVGMSRGRNNNRLYLITERPDLPEDQQPDRHAVFSDVMATDATERSAHTVARQEMEYEGSLQKWGGVWKDVAQMEAESRYGQVLREVYGVSGYRELRGEEAYGSLMRLARHAKGQGWDAERMLREVTEGGPSLADAESGSKVLHWRLERRIERYEKAETRQRERDIQQRVDARRQQVTETSGAAQLQPEAAAESDDATQRTAGEAAAGQLHTMQHAETLHENTPQVRHEAAEERRTAAEERADWRTRARDMDGELGDFARRIADFREERREVLGQQLAEAEELPQWAERLGTRPAPENERFHEEWKRRAGAIAAYREAHGYENDRDAIGPRPPRGSVDARTDWESAYRGLGEPEERMDLVGASDQQLREISERYEREEQWAPPYVADQLREVHEDRQSWRREATQSRARAAEIDDPADRAELENEAAGYDDLYEMLGDRVEKLESVHQARQGWHEETADTRQQAQDARRELELRAPEPVEAPEPQPEAPAVEHGDDEHRDAERTRERDESRGLQGDDLDRAVTAAERAQEILAERTAAAQAERQPESEAPAVDPPAYEASVEPPQLD